jgi:hypothetical protein
MVNYIDNIQSRVKVTVASEKDSEEPGAIPQESQEYQQDKVLRECDDFLRESRRLRDLEALKKMGKT